MAKRVQLSSALLAGSLLHAGTAAALGLGDITLKSYLNEPLEAEVRLIDTRDLTADDIKVRLAGVEDFERMGVERSYFLTRIEFDISVDRASNRGVIRLRTQEPVLEPFIDVVIEARWPTGRLLREYTVLVDPPVFREEPLVVSASEQVAEADRDSQVPAVAPEPQPEARTAARQDQGRLATRASDLAPGDMPRRAFSSETAESPAPGRRYMVRRDETLWQIASRGRPEGISVQQAMLDIQRLNPEAFIDGNINRIKAGYIIYLPAQGDISSDDLARALSEVRQQNADWAQDRGTVPGVTAAASLRISADPADADAAATRAAAGAARDVAESTAESAPSTGSSATVVASSGDAEPAGEPSDTATASAGGVEEGGDAAVNSELAAQLDRMASRLDSLEQIVAVKDEQIASLEAALREAREAADAAPAVAAPELPRSGTRSDAAAEARATKPEAGLPGWLRHWPYAAGAALILALLGLLVARRRRDAGADPGADSPFTTADDDSGDDVFAGVTLRDEPLAASDAGAGSAPVRAEAEPEKRDSSPARDNRGYGERRYDDYIDDADTGDALAEADIYIAYGRYLQAAELLNTAMTAEPENPAYRLKLMELYVDMGEPARAREQLEALRALGDEDSIARAEAILGDGPGAGDSATVAPPAEWERVPAFPSEPEFEPASEDGAGALSQTVPELRPEPETEPAPEPDTLPEPDLETRTFSESESLGEAEPEPESAADPELELELEPESSPESESRTDREPELELELEPETSAAAAWQGNDEPAPDDAESELELDLDLEADHAGQDAADSRAQPDNGTADVGAASSEVEEIDYAPLEFTLDESEYAAPDAARPGADAGSSDNEAGADDEALDLELEFDELTIEEPTSSQPARGGEDELDLSEALREAESTDISGDASDHADGASDEIVFAADADQVATRLDLARAYLDMGDAEGARRILEQVAETGNEEQRSEAQSLLDRLG